MAVRLLDSINPISWRRTGRAIRRTHADAVIYSYWLPFFAPAYGTVCRSAGSEIRHVALVHNALPHERRAGDALLSRHFLRKCDGIMVLSEAVEADVRSLVPDADVRRAAHPAYDLFGAAPSRQDSRQTLGIPEDAPVGLFFGFIRPYKGLELLIRALPEVIGALPGFQLIVAGEFYEPKERYTHLIDELGVTAHVRIIDAYIPSNEVGQYFAAADVAIQPYLSATQSGVAQVAWQYGVPLIVTDVGGLAEVVPHEKAGLVVPPGDASALARAVVRFFDDQMATRLRAGAREQKEQMGWGPFVDELQPLLTPTS